MKILLIDDEWSVYVSVSLVLQFRLPEVELVYAARGEEGVEMARTTMPDMIILDLGLPDISGFEVMKSIRSFSNVPIMILSVRGQVEDISRAMKLGANDYMVKPYNPKGLLLRIKDMLGQEDTG